MSWYDAKCLSLFHGSIWREHRDGRGFVVYLIRRTKVTWCGLSSYERFKDFKPGRPQASSEDNAAIDYPRLRILLVLHGGLCP